MDSFQDPPALLWEPHPSKATQMDEFRKSVNSNFGLELGTYSELYQWSVAKYQCFWERFWHFSRIIFSTPYIEVIDEKANFKDIPTWFGGSALNYAENLLKFDDDRIAIIEKGEGQEAKKVTFRELRKRVSVLASALKRSGVKRDDRVAGYLPNCSLAVEAMLATASLGAIWSSTSPDFGASGVLDRFAQIEPRVIFSVNAVVYNGKVHDHMTKLKEVVKGLPNLRNVILYPFFGSQEDINLNEIPNSVFYEDFLKLASDTDELAFEQVPFNHPLFVMYSSGTTGKPKCLVHSVGGTLIQHLKEHILHGNMTKDDVIMFYTTTGWMMWNWLVTSLAVGATIVLYDGSPLIPTPHVLFNLVDDHGITILGVSPKLLETLESKNIVPKDSHKLTSLHTMLSTGAPLMPASYDYVYRCIKKDILLGSISGGTDIISCFMGQNPTLPVHRGEIQSRNLGMAVECWDEDGNPLFDQRGELVCTKPFPSMPTRFWNDKENEKYHKAYFAKYEDVWSHGDFCIISGKTGGILMLGRSDGTLNPNGVRFGSAEIYNIVDRAKEVEDSLCVGYKNSSNEERVVLFLKMANGFKFTDDVINQLKQQIRTQLSPRHVPAKILQTQDIPYTTNGKKVEVAVKTILAGGHVNHRVSLRNPDSLDLYCNLQGLDD